LSSQVRLGVDSIFVDGVNVVLGGLQRSQLGAQVAVLAAVGASGAWRATQATRRLATLTILYI